MLRQDQDRDPEKTHALIKEINIKFNEKDRLIILFTKDFVFRPQM